MDLYALVKDFQNLIVGVGGFAGVIITLVWNASLAREQREHEAKLARDQRTEERQHERNTLQAALLAELKINRQSVQNNLDKAKDRPSAEGGGAYVPTETIDDAYRVFLPKIGLLQEDELSTVMWAYLMLQSYTAGLFLIGVPVHTGPQHVQVPAQNLELLAKMQRDLLEPIDASIAVLEAADN